MLVSMKFHVLFMRLHECKLNKCLTRSVLRVDGLKELHCHLVRLPLFMCQARLLTDRSDECGRAAESHKAGFLVDVLQIPRLGRPQPDFERARQRKLSLLLTITVLLLEQLIAMMNEVRFQTVDLFINCLLGRNWR